MLFIVHEKLLLHCGEIVMGSWAEIVVGPTITTMNKPAGWGKKQTERVGGN
jgi:hypothetical protein